MRQEEDLIEFELRSFVLGGVRMSRSTGGISLEKIANSWKDRVGRRSQTLCSLVRLGGTWR